MIFKTKAQLIHSVKASEAFDTRCQLGAQADPAHMGALLEATREAKW